MHSHEVKAENLGSFEPYNEALQLLLVDWEIASLDVEHSCWGGRLVQCGSRGIDRGGWGISRGQGGDRGM